MPLGDILVIKDEYKRAAEGISQMILRDMTEKEKVIVSVGGESGSGKSEIAHVIADNLFKSDRGLRSFILHVDDFFLLPRKERNALRVKTNLDSVGISEIDQDELAHIIKRFKGGGGLTLLPIYDILTSVQHKLIVNLRDIPVLIAEGLYANSIDADYNIFIDRTYHDTKKFQSERGKEVMDEFRFGVLEKEHQSVAKLKKAANIIIGKDYSWKML